ncbi:ABC transporter substrate-binding protein [Salinarimonas soli]|uniref:ABC transporter substrate-binding protein n=1 Tax=Salinarimonas soli TaxID=1638099 RepID=A0A5B2VFS6_9HYPH|nr:ABC transporter substrate-binding protein [Salinarimonas soli]KAA2237478.1 ABC transporter substrate-binding protein [Salinarimonas soli]
MLTRRHLLGAAAAALSAPAVARAAASRPALRVGVLPFGTVSWEVETIRALGLDAAHGFTLEPVRLAGSEAARIAFQGGAVDTIVSDLLLAARLRGEGRGVRFLPFSATEGAVMVPAGSPIAGVADLKARRLGVAGGPLDKSWLLLRAHAAEAAGLDLAAASTLSFGAPPLLAQKLEAGELDAGLLYWNFCARLEAKGFRRLIGAGDVARALGATGEIALLGYVFDEAAARKMALVDGLAAASRAAKERLAADPAAWDRLRPLMHAEDDATFEALRRAFLEGIPRRPLPEERADAERLYAVLARLGGERLVGPATRLPEGLYWREGAA